MNMIKGFFPWKRTLLVSIIILFFLNIFSFYGLYTNKFYFFKIDNYIIPILSLVHFVFLYVMWFKITEEELSDPPMRNLEFSLYIILIVYLYKAIESLFVLTSYGSYEEYLIPSTFVPFGVLIFLLYLSLIGLTLLTFRYRKELVGSYRFDEMGQHVDNWN